MTKQNWIGKPLGPHKPHNFFKTSKKNIPSYMFRDNDRDGVANVFDCKPNNPFKQGLLDAIIGAGKAVFTKGASVKAGWKEGMSTTKESRGFEKRVNRFEAEKQAERSRAQQIEKTLEPKGWESHFNVPQKRKQKGWTRQEKEFETTGKPTIEEFRKQKALREFNKEMARRVAANDPTILQKAARFMNRTGDTAARKLRTGKPSYSAKLEYRKQKVTELEDALAKAKTSKQRYALKRQLERVRTRMDVQQFERKKRKEKSMHRAVELAFPVTYMASYGSSSGGKTVSGIPGRGRGRPRGSLDRRYAPYGGVMGYRKYLSSQRRALRDQLQQQQEMLKMNRIKRSQYEQIQQARQVEQGVQQVPQEMQGAAQDYSQYQQLEQQQQQPKQQQPQYQEQYQEQPQYQSQQYQPQQTYAQGYPQQQYAPVQKKPIATVFKGSGGSPYKIPQQGLAPSNMYQDVVESTDMFSGKRIMVKKPTPEKWSRGY